MNGDQERCNFLSLSCQGSERVLRKKQGQGTQVLQAIKWKWALDCFFFVCLFIVFVLSHHRAFGVLVPQPGIEPTLLALKGRVLTTGLPGRSWYWTVLFSNPLSPAFLNNSVVYCNDRLSCIYLEDNNKCSINDTSCVLLPKLELCIKRWIHISPHVSCEL